MSRRILALFTAVTVALGIMVSGGGAVYAAEAHVPENPDQEITTGWVNDNGKTYYADDTGAYVTGWQDIDGSRYYFGKKTSVMYTGFHKISGSKYYFGKTTGKMYTGFTKISGRKYYFGKTSGKMYTGMHKIKKNVYTFDEDGVLVRTVYGSKKAIALTYDDGPSPNTGTILNTLEKYDGLATFFVVGSRVSSYKSQLKRAYNMGCQIGNHSWNHGWYGQMNSSQIASQISRCNSAVKKQIGEAPVICRTPGGDQSSNVRNSVGMPIILWSIDTRDWATQNSSKTYSSVVNGAYDGAIALMHDLYKPTADASKRIIPQLVSQGYQLVTIEELRLLKGYKLKPGRVYTSFR